MRDILRIALRRSPKPGALTATALNVPRSLFTISIACASPSMSSAIRTSGLPCCTIFQDRQDLLRVGYFLSVIRMYGFSRTASILSVSVIMYGDVAAVELHTFYNFQLRQEAAGFFNGDDAVFAHFIHRFCNQLTNFIVSGYGSDLSDFLVVLNFFCDVLKFSHSALTALSIPLRMIIGFAPAVTFFRPSRIIA